MANKTIYFVTESSGYMDIQIYLIPDTDPIFLWDNESIARHLNERYVEPDDDPSVKQYYTHKKPKLR